MWLHQIQPFCHHELICLNLSHCSFTTIWMPGRSNLASSSIISATWGAAGLLYWSHVLWGRGQRGIRPQHFSQKSKQIEDNSPAEGRESETRGSEEVQGETCVQAALSLFALLFAYLCICLSESLAEGRHLDRCDEAAWATLVSSAEHHPSSWELSVWWPLQWDDHRALGEVKCALWWISSPSTYVCAALQRVQPLLLSISHPMKADHPDFVRRNQEEMLSCIRWSDIQQEALANNKESLGKKQDLEKTEQRTWLSRKVSGAWSLMLSPLSCRYHLWSVWAPPLLFLSLFWSFLKQKNVWLLVRICSSVKICVCL